MFAAIPLFLKGLDWGKLLIRALPVLAVMGLLWGVYHLGSNHGEAVVQARWDHAVQVNLKKIEQLKAKIAQHEAAHRDESKRITHDLSQAHEKYSTSLAALDGKYAVRMRNSEQRAAYYRSQATSGPIECGNLAGHAAGLDKSLEEGRRLVEEFRSTVELRDTQLRALGQQILADRKLMGENDGHDAASAQ